MGVTEGSIAAIYHSQKDNPLYDSPYLQILNIKPTVIGKSSDVVRIKSLISDGLHVMQAVFASKFTQYFEDNSLREFSIIRLRAFNVTTHKNHVFVYINEIEEYSDYDELVGNPVDYGKSLEITNSDNSKKVSHQMKTTQENIKISPVNSSFPQNTPERDYLLKNNSSPQNANRNRNYNDTSVSSHHNNPNNVHISNNMSRAAEVVEESHNQSDYSNFLGKKTAHNQNLKTTTSSVFIKNENLEHNLTNQDHSKRPNSILSDLEDDVLDPPMKLKAEHHRNNSEAVLKKRAIEEKATFKKSSENNNSKGELSSTNKHKSKTGDALNTSSEGKDVIQINALNPFFPKWQIKARCTFKSDIRTFKNSKGEGRLFSVTLQDESGSIKATAFSECVDLFHSLFDAGKFFLVSRAQVKMANKKYSQATSDYELMLDKNSQVQVLLDESAPKYAFQFTSISDLSTLKPVVDVIGAVKEIYNPQTITLKNTGAEQLKRDLILIDTTGQVRLTLWGTKTALEIKEGDILAISSALVKEYNGIGLSHSSSTQININPDLEDCFVLKGWYDNEGKMTVVKKSNNEHRFFISEVIDEEIKYASFKATVLLIKEDSLYYDACSVCNKKVFEESINIFRCEKCNKTYEGCTQRYIIRSQVSDFTQTLWLSIFDEQGKTFFNASASDLHNLSLDSVSQNEQIIKSVYLKEFIFKTCLKIDNYSGETRNKYNCISITPLDVLDECKKLLKAIKASL